jgi:hypothetical protein
MKSPQLPLNNEVTTFLDSQAHPLREEIEQLRRCILAANSQLTETIKWNGPNYRFENDDRITMKIHPPKQLQLIFHRGARVKDLPKEKLIDDKSGLLEWKTNDRAVATFQNRIAIERSREKLATIINQWLASTP